MIFQVSGATEEYSHIIKIYGFLKTFQTKVFFCSPCCALSGVSISTLASFIRRCYLVTLKITKHKATWEPVILSCCKPRSQIYLFAGMNDKKS